MERILKIVIDLLRGATYDYETKFTQADSQSHYLQIDFKDTEIDFSGVSMKVNFIRSDGVAVTTSKASVTSSNKVQIPTNALAKFGELGIEIILIKGDSILTVNKLIRVTVIKTLAGEGIDLEIGDSFLNEINQLTVNLSKVLTGEGDKQIERVRATGNEVVKQVESILGNNPEGGNAAAVGGLSRAGIETLIDNVVGKVEDGKFPLTSAEVGKVYEAVNGKKYKCIKAYSGSQLSAPNSNFEELSVYANRSKLDNLFTVVWDKNIYLGGSSITSTNAILGDIHIPSNTKHLIFDMVTGGNDNNVISTIVEMKFFENANYNVHLPSKNFAIDNARAITKFQIINNKLILVDKSTANEHHILKITATLF